MKASLLIATFLLCGLAPTADAIQVDIAGQTIIIPAPPHFVEISKLAPERVALLDATLPEGIALLAVFINAADLDRVRSDEPFVLDQYMLVQAVEEVEQYTFTKFEFREVRTAVRREYEVISQDSESISASLKEIESRLSQETGTEVDLEMDRLIFLGIDAETPSSISASMLARYSFSVGGERAQYVMMACTQTSLLVKGTVIHINVYHSYTNESDLAWVREQAQNWLKSILAANETPRKLALGAIVPQDTPVSSTAEEILSEEWLEYRLKSHPKAHGLDISIKYPQSWKAEEGERTHIVQKFIGQSAGGVVPLYMIIVQDMPPWAGLFLRGQLAAEALAENLKTMIPEGAAFIDGGQTKLDGEPCVWVKFSHEGERAGVQVRMYVLQWMLVWETQAIVVQCSVVSGIADDEILRDAFTSYLPVFQMVGNSIVIHDK